MNFEEIREMNEISPDELETLQERKKRIDGILKDVVDPEWHKNGNHPPCWELRTVLGEKVAEVDTWMGHFQEPHHPDVLGVRVRLRLSESACKEMKTILLRDEERDTNPEEFINRAKKLVEEEWLPECAYDAAMDGLYPRSLIMVAEPKPVCCPTCGQMHAKEETQNVQQ